MNLQCRGQISTTRWKASFFSSSLYFLTTKHEAARGVLCICLSHLHQCQLPGPRETTTNKRNSWSSDAMWGHHGNHSCSRQRRRDGLFAGIWTSWHGKKCHSDTSDAVQPRICLKTVHYNFAWYGSQRKWVSCRQWQLLAGKTVTMESCAGLLLTADQIRHSIITHMTYMYTKYFVKEHATDYWPLYYSYSYNLSTITITYYCYHCIKGLLLLGNF